MRLFDHIQEPLPVKSWCLWRSREPQPSPLDVYQVVEYQPPPVPEPPNHQRNRTFTFLLRAFQFLWLVGIGVWIIIAVRYSYKLFPESPINPVRHWFAHKIFITALVFTVVVSCFGIPYATKNRIPWSHFGLVVIYVALAISAFAIITIFKPDNCEKTNLFPIHVKLHSGHLRSATVYINNEPYYDLTHKRENGVYHTYISAEYLIWNPLRGQFEKQIIPWPHETGVSSIWTSLKPAMGADGTIRGTCNGQPCLNGRFWMTPNLVFEWDYQNPITGVKQRTKLESNEGRWYFGKRNRALVSLHANGTEVFRAQSSSTVCTAGDGELETSLVPVGLMLIAENNFKVI